MSNIKQIIKSHNTRVLSKSLPDPPPSRTCNCRVKADCPLRGECLVSSVIYKATVASGATSKQYVDRLGGLVVRASALQSEGLEFDSRLGHTKDFKNGTYCLLLGTQHKQWSRKTSQ